MSRWASMFVLGLACMGMDGSCRPKIDTLPARPLHFSADYSLGEVATYEPSPPLPYAHLNPLGPAKGDMNVPDGQKACLEIDPTVSDLTSLEKLAPNDLQAMNIMHPIKDADLAPIAHLTGLENLMLRETGTGDTGVSHLRGLINLISLDLSGSRATTVGVQNLAGMRRLESLDLTGADIDDDALAVIGRLTSLKQLDIGSARLTDAGLAHLERLQLIAFRCSRGDFTDAGLSHVHTKCLNLTQPARRSGVTDATIVSLARNPKLNHLSFTGVSITGRGLSVLKDQKYLYELFLCDVPITDEALEYIAAIPNLHNLGLSETKVTDAGVARLKACKSLLILNLQKTAIGDEALKVLAEVKTLEYLTLDDTRVTDVGVAQLASLPNLRHVSVDRTQVTQHALDMLPHLSDRHEK